MLVQSYDGLRKNDLLLYLHYDHHATSTVMWLQSRNLATDSHLRLYLQHPAVTWLRFNDPFCWFSARKAHWGSWTCLNIKWFASWLCDTLNDNCQWKFWSQLFVVNQGLSIICWEGQQLLAPTACTVWSNVLYKSYVLGDCALPYSLKSCPKHCWWQEFRSVAYVAFHSYLDKMLRLVLNATSFL